jgi:GTP-binding protein
MADSLPTAKPLVVALAGRPNVGKSTLFNLLAEGPKALVHDTPGVTRDIRRQPAQMGDLVCELIDTAGAITQSDGLEKDISDLSYHAWQQADVIVFVLDGRDGLTPEDESLAQQLRSLGKPVVPVLNKSDLKSAETVGFELLSLGFGDAVPVSAAHNDGLYELAEAVVDAAPKGMGVDVKEEEDPVWKLAIIGRPNAGKSTLVNKLLRDERMLTGDTAGLTRESIAHRWQVEDKIIELVDTPGVRKKARISEELEQQSVGSALTAADKADAVILLLDATTYIPNDPRSGPLEQQDLKLAQLILAQGKPLVVVLNKWDIMPDKDECRAFTKFQIEKSLSQVKELPMIALSAKTGKGLDRILPAVEEVLTKWSVDLSTSALNRWLEETLMQNPPPLSKGRSIRLKFMRQVRRRPPVFGVFGNRTGAVPASYKRYMLNKLAADFDLKGIPLQIEFKQTDNPYGS